MDERTLRSLVDKKYTSGEIITLCRKRLKWSMMVLSNKSRVDFATIFSIENNLVTITDKQAEMIADALKISKKSILYPNGEE